MNAHPPPRRSAFAEGWSPDSWRERPAKHQPEYDDPEELRAALDRIARFPPLVTSGEIEQLREQLAAAAEGRAFVLQGGDCAESFADCTPDKITSKLKILLQMSLVLVQGLKKPVVRIGRMAGQYAKPRSSPVETRDGIALPSYLGDSINGAEFEPAVRRHDPKRLVEAQVHAAMTLNFVRGLVAGGFADLHHPDYWSLQFLGKADLHEQLRADYTRLRDDLGNAIRVMEVVSGRRFERLTTIEFFTSHEGLVLPQEQALSRSVPRRSGHWNLSCHMPWIGDRTRALDGAHIEFFRGIRNPVGLKVGPSIPPEELAAVADRLDPEREPGRLVLIGRFGAARIDQFLPPLVEAMQREGRRPVWLCDPMHGNTSTTSTGIKTRKFGNVLQELLRSVDIHEELGSNLAGVHFELTGENVTECLGGAAGVTEDDLNIAYHTLCDPRLNYEQAMELAFAAASRLSR